MSVDRSNQVSPKPSTGTRPVIACVSLQMIAKLKGHLPAYRPAAGAVLIPCPLCGDQMWLGPLCRDKVEKENVPAYCGICLIKGGATPFQLISLGGE